MTMIERVAKAIHETWAINEGSTTTWEALCDIQELDGYPTAKKHYALALDEARAAIEAMRLADGPMSAAGIKRATSWRREGAKTDGYPAAPEQAIYTAMIDAALGEQA